MLLLQWVLVPLWKYATQGKKCSTMETSVNSVQHPTLWPCRLTSTMRWNARIAVFKSLSVIIGCSKGAQLAAQAASFCKSATSRQHLVPTPRTARWQYLVPRNLCFQTASALTSISGTFLAAKRRMKLTASPTLRIDRNARIFAVIQLIAESGPFTMTFAFSAATGIADKWDVQELDQIIVCTIVVLFSLISPPVMCSMMKTDLVALETCHLILCCRNLFNKVRA